MKLKNKKTGVIGKLHCDMQVTPAKIGVFEDTKDGLRGHYWEYRSLAELCEEWEDYEGPKDYWFVSDGAGHEVGIFASEKGLFPEIEKYRKEIGNYFETEEEAKKAVEKLKAWERLKDKHGFKFIGWDRDQDYFGDFRIAAIDETSCDDEDLDLLFGRNQ